MGNAAQMHEGPSPERSQGSVRGPADTAARGPTAPAGGYAAAILSLQGRVGNAATGALLARAQRKLLVGAGEQGQVAVRRFTKLGADGGELSAGTEEAIRTAQGTGNPLDAAARATMEQAFRADFSHVRVHTGQGATELNDRVQAKAFTVGADIFLRGPAPDPHSPDGQALMAHELTHTIQQ